MTLLADVRAWVLQRSAASSARYGDVLQQLNRGPRIAEPDRVRVPTRHGRVRCDVYRPPGSPTAPPVYVHLHGGAFVMRHPRMDDFFARIVAAECGAVVVNVDYDVAPQARFPVAQHQAHDVAAWVAHHGISFGVDAGRVAVGGFSAGGNLAASVALQARDAGSFRPACQLLGVPSLDVAEDPAEKPSPLARPMVSPELMALVRATYFRDEAARASAYASPLRAGDLTGLAPALIVTAEYDALRREGDRYADRLRDAAVPVTHHVVPAADHYFLDGDLVRARATLDLLTSTLRDHLGVEPWTLR
ncbi:MAG: alpha/beta hydrolase [Marmoricola sp.]